AGGRIASASAATTIESTNDFLGIPVLLNRSPVFWPGKNVCEMNPTRSICVRPERKCRNLSQCGARDPRDLADPIVRIPGERSQFVDARVRARARRGRSFLDIA